MTEATFIQLVFALCTYGNPPAVDYREPKIACFETYTNCAVGPGGRILNMVEFKQKCLGAQSEHSKVSKE